MFVTIGRTFGRLPHELREIPLHWLMWDYLSLREAMRADDIIAERDRIREAALATFSMHNPEGLRGEDRKLIARARAFSRGEPEPRQRTRAELLEYARRMHADIAARGVMVDTPQPVS